MTDPQTTDITILTKASCASCVQAKEVLSGLRQDYSLEIREVSLETEEGRELAGRTGVVFAPGILINGKLFSYGRLSEKKLRRHLTHPPPPVQ
ncbi:glutaredoxin family protein [Pseudarthrobacter raffinosi]|uniref:glutaredoxin family protein n=1 Tax=Pseudarthrobacter raffinosi TaxID=2953651 RepID=UPI00208F904E|nr:MULTISPECIES: glutaredoxin domain-containing protein [unclassified Pseudarthrobacter]MCO4239214.1 glutaredoxin [Pseudarthrobacter sp. MDT3-28]MCO4265214.1 glutaredoxin [Pseudarthrobacter sp. MDT3-26]